MLKYLLISLLFLFLISCEGDYDITYKFTDLSLEHAENSGKKPIYSNADSISASYYVLRLNLFPVELSRKGRYLDRETPPGNVNPIDSILVTSNNDFNATHPEGSSLSKMFRILNSNYFHTSSLNKPYISNQYSEDFYTNPLPNYADLLLIGQADLPKNHIFKVKLFFHDGSTLTDSSSVIRLY